MRPLAAAFFVAALAAMTVVRSEGASLTPAELDARGCFCTRPAPGRG
ncbi:MAG: hypothetical protein HY059_09320 [Proteobacteria bacterium]|nr:hypothetical protein [Pseudomonadota bacterium]